MIIAEIGSNWKCEGLAKSLDLALRSISVAAESGADAVKFQLFTADTLYSKKRFLRGWKSVRPYELPVEWLPKLSDMAMKNSVELWLSVFSASLLKPEVALADGIKIASGDMVNNQLIGAVVDFAALHNQTFAISTGAADGAEVTHMHRLVRSLIKAKVKTPRNVVFFHCVSAYPAAPVDINLSGGECVFTRIPNVPTYLGLSDHTLDSRAGMCARARLYTHFEKHFMAEHWESPDAAVSLTPARFSDYCQAIQLARKMVGCGSKVVQESEILERVFARRGADGLRPNGDCQ